MRKRKNSLLSIVIPLYNEAQVIPYLVKRIKETLQTNHIDAEIVFVDDGSTDSTFNLLSKLKAPFSVTIIRLSRNFGHQSALMAGLMASKGDIIVTMDGDLQHPPELITEFIALHDKGYDIVLTQRIDEEKVSELKKLGSALFYLIFNNVSNHSFTPSTSDFRSMNRRSVTTLLNLPENRKYLRGMVQWIGYKSVIIPYKADSRVRGKSKYSLHKMIRLAIHGIISFSALPLYFAGMFSAILFVFASAYGLYVLIAKFVLDVTVSGWASVILVILVIGGVLSLLMGVFGLYLAAIYEEVKKRPNYIVDTVTKNKI